MPGGYPERHGAPMHMHLSSNAGQALESGFSRVKFRGYGAGVAKLWTLGFEIF